MTGMCGRISGFEGPQFFLNVPGQILENIVELPSHFNHTLPHPENYLNARQINAHFFHEDLGKPKSFEVLGRKHLFRVIFATDGTDDLFLLQFREETLGDLELLDNFGDCPEFFGHTVSSPQTSSPASAKKSVAAALQRKIDSVHNPTVL